MACCLPKSEEETVQREDLSPLPTRTRTDRIMIPIFLLFVGATLYAGVKGSMLGDWNRLIYGISSNNTVCGVGTQKARPKLLYCFTPDAPVTSANITNTVFTLCIDKCPKSKEALIAIYEAHKSEFVAQTESADYWDPEGEYSGLLNACVQPSISVLNRCVFDFTFGANASDTKPHFSEDKLGNPGDLVLAGAGQMLMNAYNDLLTTWWIILSISIGLGTIVSILYLQSLRYFVTPMVWLTIVSFFLCLIAFTMYCGVEAGYIGNSEQATNPTGETSSVQQSSSTLYLIVFWFCIAMLIWLLFSLIFTLNRIRLAIALIQEATKALRIMPWLSVSPLPVLLACLGIFAYMLFMGCYIATAGDIVDGNLVWSAHIQGMIAVHFFVCLWSMAVFQCLQLIVIAGAVSQYYWARDKNELDRPITRAWNVGLKYHFGSVLFAAMIQAIVRLLKFYMLALAMMIYMTQGKTNRVITFVYGCFACLLRMVEKVVRLFTENAFIMIAVEGRPYCISALLGFNLIKSNAPRMTAVNSISQYLFLLGKVAVASSAALITYRILEKYYVYGTGENTVSSPFVPTLATFLVAYIVAWVFFEVCSFSIDVILLCFCLDDIRNRNTGNYYASTHLIKFMACAPKLAPPPPPR